MFLLLGIQILQLINLPFIYLEFDILSLGSIFKLPSIIVQSFTNSWDNYEFIMISIGYIFIIIGLFIFSIGVINWLQGIIEKKDIFDDIIYKYSRHPQYLGYLFWRYGVYLLSFTLNDLIRGGIIFEYTFIWFISSMIIIGICLYEEVLMNEKYPKNIRTIEVKHLF